MKPEIFEKADSINQSLYLLRKTQEMLQSGKAKSISIRINATEVAEIITDTVLVETIQQTALRRIAKQIADLEKEFAKL